MRPALTRPFSLAAALALILPLALLGPGCGSDFEATGPGKLERPRLTRETPLPAPLATRREQRLEVPEKLAPWRVEGSAEVAPRKQRAGVDAGDFLLRSKGPGPWKVTVPGRFDPRRFNQIAVRGRFKSNVSIELTLSAEGHPAYTPDALATANTDREQVLLFDLPYVRQIPFVYEAITLDLARVEAEDAVDFDLLSIDLLDLPIQLYLPDAESEGALIDLGVESRHGVGLASGEPVACEFDVEPGDRLSFALALLPHLRANGREPTVHVTLAAGTRNDSWSFALEDEDDEPSRWNDERIDLSPFAGKRVRATFRFDVTKDRRAICALAGLEVWRPGAAPRAVLMITSDTHRGDHIGTAESGVQIDTPVLDALAARGVLFENCWSTTNVTSPSHVSLMTGVHPRDHRIIGNVARMSERAATLAEEYRAAGFATLGVVSVHHLGPRGTGLGQGFDRMIGPLHVPWDAEVAVGHMMDLVGASDGKPIFAWLHVFDAHHPYAPPGEYDRKYYPKGKDPFDPSLPAHVIEEGSIPKDLADVRDLEFPRSQYRAEISFLDSQLVRLFDMPPLRDALIAVTSDHGEILEKDGTYFNHGAVFPDTLHVPLILAGPGVPAGERVATPVEHIDLGRTLLDLSGRQGADFPGRNLLFALEEDGSERPPRFALGANGTSASITDGKWHFILSLRSHKGPLRRKRMAHEGELYDLDADPECLVDVDERETEKAAELRARLVEWLADAGGEVLMERLTHTTAGLAQLAALGYATGAEEVDEDKPWYVPPSAGEGD